MISDDLIRKIYQDENVDLDKARIEIEAFRKKDVTKNYSQLRKNEYDKLNQDELRFNDAMNGTTTWIDSILAIKAKYPKPNNEQ